MFCVMGIEHWNPWRFAAVHLPHVIIDTSHRLPRGVAGLWRGDRIWLCSTLDRAGRRSVLTHEVWHVRRGEVPPWITEREERTVDDLASRDLIGLEQLIDGLRWSDQEAELAEVLDVDVHTVRCRLKNLTPDEMRLIERRVDWEGIA